MFGARFLALLLAPWMGFSVGAWPGEGVPVIQALGPEVAMYAEPSFAATATNHRVTAGATLSWKETLYRTEGPGLLVVERAGSTPALSLPNRHHLSSDDFFLRTNRRVTLHLDRGALLVYLQYESEGTCVVAHDGEPFLLERCPLLSLQDMEPPELVVRAGDAVDPTFRPVLAASTQWWVRLVDGKKAPIGWIPVHPSAQVRVSDRTF